MGSSIREAYLAAVERKKSKQSSSEVVGKVNNDAQLAIIDITAANQSIAAKFSRNWDIHRSDKKQQDYAYLSGVSITTLAIWLRTETETPYTLLHGLNQAGYSRKEAAKMVSKARAIIGDYR